MILASSRLKLPLYVPLYIQIRWSKFLPRSKFREVSPGPARGSRVRCLVVGFGVQSPALGFESRMLIGCPGHNFSGMLNLIYF